MAEAVSGAEDARIKLAIRAFEARVALTSDHFGSK
jgi:hypothetical protein